MWCGGDCEWERVDGRIVDRGTPDDLIYRFGRQNLEEVFLDIARDPGEVARYKADRRRVDKVSARWFAAMNEAIARVSGDFP